MDRFTRKELKTDRFATRVGNTVEFLEDHRRQAAIIGAAVLALILAIVGGYYYLQHQHSERQEALRNALRIWDANIDTQDSPFFETFDTQEEKDEAIVAAFTEITEKYPGSDEATIAGFYLALAALQTGDPAKAEEKLSEVMEDGNNPYASQAAFSLAQLHAGNGDVEKAEEILRDLIENPTILVSKEQATIELARVLAETNPEEARKLLEPLRTERSAVSRAALTALGNLPQQ